LELSADEARRLSLDPQCPTPEPTRAPTPEPRHTAAATTEPAPPASIFLPGPRAGETRTNEKDGQEYVYIPAGSFHMRPPLERAGARGDRRGGPPHAFWPGAQRPGGRPRPPPRPARTRE